jgi:hypothetical protein
MHGPVVSSPAGFDGNGRKSMKRTRSVWIGATFLILLVALGVAQATLERIAAAQNQGALQEI